MIYRFLVLYFIFTFFSLNLPAQDQCKDLKEYYKKEVKRLGDEKRRLDDARLTIEKEKNKANDDLNKCRQSGNRTTIPGTKGGGIIVDCSECEARAGRLNRRVTDLERRIRGLNAEIATLRNNLQASAAGKLSCEQLNQVLSEDKRDLTARIDTLIIFKDNLILEVDTLKVKVDSLSFSLTNTNDDLRSIVQYTTSTSLNIYVEYKLFLRKKTVILPLSHYKKLAEYLENKPKSKVRKNIKAKRVRRFIVTAEIFSDEGGKEINCPIIVKNESNDEEYPLELKLRQRDNPVFNNYRLFEGKESGSYLKSKRSIFRKKNRQFFLTAGTSYKIIIQNTQYETLFNNLEFTLY